MLKPKTLLFLLLGLMMLAPPGRLRAQDAEEEGDEPPVPRATIALAHVSAVVRLYEPDETPPKAIFIFGSGDGGWSPWEDVVARWLRDAGVYVVGFDLHDYSEKDYTQDLLGKDMATLAADAATRCNGSEVPVIYGGWSMGAVQAVAAAASKTRPPHLAGLILMSADDRGRYGLRKSDELGITPEGPGTFGLADFSGAVKDLRVAQFHGSADFMASMAWIQTLKSPHALYVVPRANHGFDGPDDAFQEWIQRGLNWVLGDEQAAAPPPHRELPFGLSPLWPAALVSVLLTGFFLISKKHSIRILVAAVLVMGLIDLLESVFNKPPLVLAWMEQWVPLGMVEQSRLLLFLSGLSLLALARGLSRRKRIAWWLSVLMLIASAVLHLSRAFDWHHAVAAALLLVPLIRWRKEFIARSDASSLRWGLGLVAATAGGLFIYGTISLHQFSERGEFGEPLSWRACAAGSATAFVLQKSELDEDGSRAARAFLRHLRGGSLLGGLLALGLLLRPVLQSRHPRGTPEELTQVKALIDQFGEDPMDSFALLPDKRFFFSPDHGCPVNGIHHF